MGSSKIILVSGLCVMLGFYAYVIQKASQSIVSAGTDRRTTTQARLLSNAALNTVNYYFSTPGGQTSYNKSNVSMSGGKMSWSTDTTYMTSMGIVTVTATGVYGLDTVKQYARLRLTSSGGTWGSKKRWFTWGVDRIFADKPKFHEEELRVDTRF